MTFEWNFRDEIYFQLLIFILLISKLNLNIIIRLFLGGY